MIQDEDLKNTHDYTKGQKEAAHRVLIELVNLFDSYKEDIRIVGGWVPDLMFPEDNHIGSIDVDILINHLTLKDVGYMTLEKILLKNSYLEHPYKYFSYYKEINIDGIIYSVDVDILAGIYGGTTIKKRSQHVQGIKALKATGGNFAFEFPPQKITIEAKGPDGAIDTATVNVVAVVPYLIMKAAAIGRGKPKDAYDIYFLIKHYQGGIKALAKEFTHVSEKDIVLQMIEKLTGKFASMDHAGPKDVADFLDLTEDEAEYVKRDASEQVMKLITLISLKCLL